MIENRERNPEGKLLLYRYLDFEVRPGSTYRYRVRLVLYNPNENLRPELVVSPEVAEGTLRNTEWSEPTAPVSVPEDADYFVSRVDAGRQGPIPSAYIDLFQWSPASGTVVNSTVGGTFLKTLVGQYFGGEVKTHVLVPVQQKFEKENFLFSTDDVLVDVAQRPAADRALHAELQFPANAKSAPGLSDQVLVMNRFGELVSVNAAAQESTWQKIKARFEEQNKYWTDIKDALVHEATVGPRESKRGNDDEKDADRKLGPGGKKIPGDNPRRRRPNKQKD
jgi:hypothetical protein